MCLGPDSFHLFSAFCCVGVESVLPGSLTQLWLQNLPVTDSFISSAQYANASSLAGVPVTLASHCDHGGAKSDGN